MKSRLGGSQIKFFLYVVFIFSYAVPVSAQRVDLINSRYWGDVTVLRLTNEQKAYIDLLKKCMPGKAAALRSESPPAISNEYSPYVFTLTDEQSEQLKREGVAPARKYAIFESYKDEDVELNKNVVIRFSADKIEIPRTLVIPDKEAEDWEKNVMGWKANPLAEIPLALPMPSECPALN